MKKALSILLVLVLCLGLAPAAISVIEPPADINTITEQFNGHTYTLFDWPVTELEAEEYCRQQGGHLVTITDEAELSFVNSLFSKGRLDIYFIGAIKGEDGRWYWMTGEPWLFDIWTPNQPDNTDNRERNAEAWREYGWYWNDISNDDYTRGFVCEWDFISSDWAQTEIDKAKDMDLIPDVLKNQDLTKSITRAEFAAVAVKVFENLSGGKAVPIVNNPFTDTKDVEVLKAYGIGAVNGTSATTFTPDALLNREQCATMLTRVFKRITLAGWTLENDSRFKLDYKMPAKFADDADISDYARDSVYFMAANGIIKGVGNNRFAPKNTTTAQEAQGYANATREQALAIAVRMVENLG